MESRELGEQVLRTWRRHNDILLFLLRAVPAKGFAALPAGSRGRDVARQFNHLNRVRLGWLYHHRTGKHYPASKPSHSGIYRHCDRNRWDANPYPVIREYL